MMLANMNRVLHYPILFIAIGLFLFTTCNMQKKDFLEQFTKKIPVEIQREEILRGQLDPTAIYLMDDVILLLSRGMDNYLFSIIDTVDFKEVSRFGIQGKGPMEIGACGFVSKINNDSILVLDITDYEVYLFSIKQILKGKQSPLSIYRTRNNVGSIRCNSITVTDVGHYIIGTGIFPEGRYALFDTTGLITGYYVEYPEFKETTDKNPFINVMAYQSIICKQPNSNLLAGVGFEMIDIIECGTKGIRLKKRTEYFKSEMKVTGYQKVKDVNYPKVAYSKESIVGFEQPHLQGTKTFIYSLFSPRTLKEVGFHAKLLFTDLVTFDWNGVPKTRYVLDKEVSGFAISENNRKAYFLSNNESGEAVILVAKLN